MQDAKNQNASRALAVEHNMAAALHSAQAGTNIITPSAQGGIIGQHLATRFKIVEVTDGLVFAPCAKGISADAQQVGFRTARETKESHVSD